VTQEVADERRWALAWQINDLEQERHCSLDAGTARQRSAVRNRVDQPFGLSPSSSRLKMMIRKAIRVVGRRQVRKCGCGKIQGPDLLEGFSRSAQTAHEGVRSRTERTQPSRSCLRTFLERKRTQSG
jgi:hypothetical protein